MHFFRIALANVRYPPTPKDSVTLAEQVVTQASLAGASLVCFPDCFVAGYRGLGKSPPPPNPAFLQHAWSVIANTTAKAHLSVILGTERVADGNLLAIALVINPNGSFAGFQDKVQLDPSEEGTYSHGSGRQIFQAGPLTFGVVICHEGWRYPETVRWLPRQGAQVYSHFLRFSADAAANSTAPTKCQSF